MRKIFIRILAFMLVAISAISLCACVDNDGDSNKKKGLIINKINGTYTITKYNEDELTDGVLDIAKILADREISSDVKIKAGAFSGNTNIKSLIVPSQVTEIDSGAFKNMNSLESLEVPFIGKTANADAFENQTGSAEDKSVDSERTFAHFFGEELYAQGTAITVNGKTVYVPCTLKNLTINAQKGRDVIGSDEKHTVSNFYSIPMNALNGAINLSSITLKGDKLQEIGEGAFSGCTALKEIVIPATVKVIYKNAFNGCSKLESVKIEGEVALKEGAFKDCVKMDRINAAADAVKTLDLAKIISAEKDSLNFGRDVEYTKNNPNNISDEAFGDNE